MVKRGDVVRRGLSKNRGNISLDVWNVIANPGNGISRALSTTSNTSSTTTNLSTVYPYGNITNLVNLMSRVVQIYDNQSSSSSPLSSSSASNSSTANNSASSLAPLTALLNITSDMNAFISSAGLASLEISVAIDSIGPGFQYLSNVLNHTHHYVNLVSKAVKNNSTLLYGVWEGMYGMMIVFFLFLLSSTLLSIPGAIVLAQISLLILLFFWLIFGWFFCALMVIGVDGSASAESMVLVYLTRESVIAYDLISYYLLGTTSGTISSSNSSNFSSSSSPSSSITSSSSTASSSASDLSSALIRGLRLSELVDLDLLESGLASFQSGFLSSVSVQAEQQSWQAPMQAAVAGLATATSAATTEAVALVQSLQPDGVRQAYGDLKSWFVCDVGAQIFAQWICIAGSGLLGCLGCVASWRLLVLLDKVTPLEPWVCRLIFLPAPVSKERCGVSSSSPSTHATLSLGERTANNERWIQNHLNEPIRGVVPNFKFLPPQYSFYVNAYNHQQYPGDDVGTKPAAVVIDSSGNKEGLDSKDALLSKASPMPYLSAAAPE
eukprot:CAMPEP_0175040732 /NCGR_PEP_ID=MMETSP0052_2-20121109/1450_1 /TAXON_ID=51329 ORGANISM="Polytomella parva, Strain SAG 63-3" /NCGR_SAMPLE_ID=MMETSP0052_2 /ASSEMBLY_ACC=CAM_ASM_000194 /LENGTH=550 /DNA_ID=CAMNT_0016303023 /DNA_START=274 /DNA_END=1922 /DNA_ORIENTATION=+